MVLTDKKYKNYLMLALSGILTGLAVIFPKIGLLAWLSLIPMGLVFLTVLPNKEVKYKTVFLYGGVMLYCYYAITLHWFLFMYPLEFIDGMSKGAALLVVCLAGLGIPVIEAVLGGAMFALSAFVLRRDLAARQGWLPLLLAPLGFTLLEWIQTLFWWGQPTGRLSMSQTELESGIQTASLFGSYFITLLVVTVNCLLAYIIIVLLQKKIKALAAPAAVIAALLVFNYGYGIYALTVKKTESTKSVRVAVIQANIDSSLKWGDDSREKIYKNYRDITVAAAEEGAKLVIFPETALPYTLYEGNSTYLYLSSLAKETGVTLLSGCFNYDENKNEYNIIVAFTPDGEMTDNFYTKRHLVPFGEYVPFKKLIRTLVPPLAELIMSGGDLSQGSEPKVFFLENANIGSGICYDAMYEDVTLESTREGAQMFTVSSNDSWFGGSAYFHMHNAQIKLRSVECGKYSCHAASTGTSMIITDKGLEVDRVAPYTEGYAIAEVPLLETGTLYSYIGNTLMYLAAAAIVVLLVLSVAETVIYRRRNRKNKDFLKNP